MKNNNFKSMVLCALFAALSAVLSQVSISLGAVPINFTHISIFIAAGMLGVKYGTISQIIFVILGAVGLPVFSGFGGGFGVILGPTGGFIIGYICCAFVTGLIIKYVGKSMKALILAMYAGWVVTYLAGIPWLMYVTKMDLTKSVTLYLLPFLPGDLLKTILSATLINRLTPIINKKSE